MVVGAVVLVTGTFLQEPGRILPETKLDLLLSPGRFLGRALQLWDPAQSFGQIQNQAAGYLLPMGPWYWLGHAIGLAPWVVQRLWIGALMAIGFWGVDRLARALGIGTPAARIVGAAAYVLGAASLTLVAFRSGTQVPVYALPWVMVPLVEAERHGHRRAAAWSGLAVALMGGVNGTATLLVLAVPVLWFLTRERASGRGRLFGWWLAAVVAATSWWAVPLALQGRYGYAFTGFTESAALTTAVSSATEVLRGTGNWLAYLTSEDRLWLPGGWQLISSRIAIVGGMALVAAGFSGLTRRDLPERRWLTLSALVGAVVMVAGYRGPLGSPFWSRARDLLDGPLVPLRNVHKAQPLLALPAMLGAIHLLGVAQRAVARRLGGADPSSARRASPVPRPARAAGIALLLVAASAVAAGGLPFVEGHVAADGSFTEVPAYWRQAGAWLDAHAHGRRSIILPASAFGEYTWGRPLDEPLASTTDEPLAVRDIVPLGSNGTTRLLDGIEDQLQSGRLDQGLGAVLQRSGVGYLVERNDLDPDRTNALPPGQVHALLAQRFGEPVATFGPLVDARLDSAHLRPQQAAARVHAVEVWPVGGPSPLLDAYPKDRGLVVGGEPEALYELSTAGLLGRQGTVLADDPAVAADQASGATPVVADASRRRDVAFGDVRFDASYTLTATQPAPGTDLPPHDRLVVPGGAHLARARLLGAARVRASSYGATDLRRDPSDQPWAAFDGDPTTAWRPSLGAPSSLDHTIGAWLEVDLDQPRDLRELSVTVPTGAFVSQATTVTVSTDAGSVVARTGPGQATVRLPPGATRTIRLTLTEARLGAEDLGAPGITEVRIPGLSLERPVATGAARSVQNPSGALSHVVLSRDHGDPFARDPAPEDSALDRRLVLDRRTAYDLSGTVVARPGPALDALLDGLVPGPPAGTQRLRATASSRWNDQPAFDPTRALDGDPATGWVAADDDPRPTLTLAWEGSRTLRSLDVTRLGPPATAVDRIVLTSASGETRTVALPRSPGVVTFAPMQTDSVSIAPAWSQAGVPVSSARAGQATGLAEVRLPDLADLVAPVLPAGARFELPCGQGPAVHVGDEDVETAVRGRVSDLIDGRPVPLETCGSAPVSLGRGSNRIATGIDGAVQVETLRLDATSGPGATAGGGGPVTAAPRPTQVIDWHDEHRKVRVGAGREAVLALTENANAGWTAQLDGARLATTRVDGWRQAWIVPAGRGGTVTLDFEPGHGYRLALGLGLALLVALVVAALPLRRRRRRPVTRLAPAGPLPLPLALAVVAGVGLVAGGWAALLAVPLLLLPGRSEVLPALVAAAAAGAAVVLLVTPGGLPQDQNGTFSAIAQGLSVLVLVALAVSLVPDDWPARLRRSGPRTAPTAAVGSTRSSRRRDGRRRRPRRSGTAPGETGTPDRPDP